MLLCLIVLTHYGYPYMALAADNGSMTIDQMSSWSFYILRGFEGAILFALLLQYPQGRGPYRMIWVLACWLGIFEESQTAVCGLISDPAVIVPLWSGLCVEQFGNLPYILFAAAALVYLFMGAKRERKT